ncbi:DhaKLM operon coactivator DhaQ [Streptococcus sciuri]|uniref:DhaKLM operon coactivator DhaQ n=1 Tax=Streptococcus sciuri TaxID=2973939 RepID=A0ABT2F6W6_9STRE|nr:DhaKLM operon coactivator DhaQ [Streptococcus sciuri]MCS4488169.1 DhaKLM operon coactivator DhaQ [Streptococcus sciuri]
MTFIHNQQKHILSDFISGQLLAYPHLKKHETLPLVYNRHHDSSKIPILSGGGSGHEPAHIGYVGEGMLTGAIYGTLFYPPTVDEIAVSIRFLDKGKGVFVIVKNFDADLAHFRKAIATVRAEGYNVKYILSYDDISIEPKKHFKIRGRGLAGTILLHKILGALAQRGASLDELEQVGFELSTQIATIGFATKSATLPRATLPLFELEENSIYYGIGIHGEEGYRTVPFTSSEELANEIVNKLKLHFHWEKGEPFILLVNNLGTTTDLEMGIFLNDLKQLFDIQGLSLPLIKSGRFMTSLDMAGISVTLCKMTDKQWLDYLLVPTDAYAW